MHSKYQLTLLRELEELDVSSHLKKLVKGKTKDVEERVYWFNTVEEQSSFLQQYWNNQVEANDVLKNRIIKITDQKLQQLFAEVNEGKIENDSIHELNVQPTAPVKMREKIESFDDIPEMNAYYFSQNHPKSKQTRQKLKKLHEKQSEFKSRMAEMKEKEREKKKQKEMLDQEIRKNLEKEKKQKYRQRIFKTLEEQKYRKEQRELQSQKFKEFMKLYKSSKPLHVLMEEQYQQKIVLPSIEENKKKMQAFTARQKPTLEEINEHDRNFMDSIINRDSNVLIAHQTIDVFKSKFYMDEKKRMMEGEDTDIIQDQLERKKRYSEIVKHNFKPQISRTLRNSIHESTLQQSTARESLDRSSLIERGKLYLQYVRTLEKSREKHISISEMTSRDKQKIENESRYINYLQGFKESRLQNNSSGAVGGWQQDLKNKKINGQQRRERVLLKSKQLEQKAFRQEQYLKNNVYGKAEELIEQKTDIDNKIISSIRAKVALLKDAQKQTQ